jgi:hypothetical protein
LMMTQPCMPMLEANLPLKKAVRDGEHKLCV